MQIDPWHKKMKLRNEQGLRTATWHQLHDEDGFKKNVHQILDENPEQWDIAIQRKKENRKVSFAMRDLLRWDVHSEGMHMCTGGWVPILQLLSSRRMTDLKATKADVYGAVAWNKKPRFQLSQKKNFIRVMCGHMFNWLDETQIFERVETSPATNMFMVHATFANHMSDILRDGIHKGNRSHIHIAEKWTDVNRRDGCDSAIYMSVHQVAKEHKVWYAANGTIMIKGPIKPHLFMRAGTWKDGCWRWVMMNGKWTDFEFQSTHTEAAIRVDLANEANFRIKHWNAQNKTQQTLYTIAPEDNDRWMIDRNSYNDQMRKFQEQRAGRQRDVVLDAPNAPKKPAYKRMYDGDLMSPEYMTETSEASEFGREQQRMNVKKAQDEEVEIRREVDTNVPMQRKRWGSGLQATPTQGQEDAAKTPRDEPQVRQTNSAQPVNPIQATDEGDQKVKYWVEWASQVGKTGEPYWGHDYGLCDRPGWGWWLPHPARKKVWFMIDVVHVNEDQKVPQPLGPKPVWMQSPAGIFGWAVWSPLWFDKPFQSKPWVHFVFANHAIDTSLWLVRTGIDRVGVLALWVRQMGWKGRTGVLPDIGSQPEPGQHLPRVGAGPKIMTNKNNKNVTHGGKGENELYEPGVWAVDGKAARSNFVKFERVSAPRWREGRAGQNKEPMDTKVAKMIFAPSSEPKTESGRKSQRAWQILHGMSQDQCLTVAELESKGYVVPCFDNLRVRLEKSNLGKSESTQAELNALNSMSPSSEDAKPYTQ